MPDEAKRLENVKQEIRSVLLSQPKDMTVSALLNDYRMMVGRSLPFTEFGYSSPDEFLRSIPDVVTMNWSKKYNMYMLRGVADATTKHIEKLVSKQKTGKSAPVPSRRTMSSAPPRFSRVHISKTSTRPYLSLHVKNEIYNVVREYRNGLSLPNFLVAFRRKYGKELVYKTFGFYTLEDCLNSIPEVLLRCEGSEMRVYPIIEKRVEENTIASFQDSSSLPQSTRSNAHNNNNKENKPTNSLMSENASFVGFTGDFARNKTMNSTSPDEHLCISAITPALKEKFKQIMKKYPQGIWVSRFPAAVMELTGYYLDHCKLGYLNLVDLFNDLPEIFRIEVLYDCRDDWLLFDATSLSQNIKESSEMKLPCDTKPSSEFRDSVVRNIRLLLQANREGIRLNDFWNLYEAICDEPFNLRDFGFDSLPVFLDSIAERVPLKIGFSGKDPRVYYKEEVSSDSVSDSMSPHSELPSDIPSDAVVGCTEYTVQNIPEDLNPAQFFPVYLSAVVDPNHIYIQLLHGKDTSDVLEKLMEELELFYYKKESEQYKIPKHCIISGLVCAAEWPTDGRWHRIRISSVPSNDTVVAFFMDYGTKERISSDNLRFLRKEFMEVPAQAIQSHLCRLRPMHGDTWDPAAKDFILTSFARQPLMACLTQGQLVKESLPLVLCDVSGENDVFLNDILVSKGFAKYETDENAEVLEDSHGAPPMVRNQNSYQEHDSRNQNFYQELHGQNLNLLPRTQEMPALPGVSEHMMSAVSTPSPKNSDNAQDLHDPVRNSLNIFNSGRLHIDTSVVGRNQDMPKPSADFFVSQSATSYPGTNFSSSTVGFSHHSAPLNPHNLPHGSDSDVFESDEEIDDDDNPEVNSISRRYVKRLKLVDGWNHVHMIVINDTPFICSGDITYLLWEHDDPDFVRRKLKCKEIFIPNNTVREVGYEQLFYQLERFRVRGVKTEVTGNHYITLFPFKNVVDILNIFGHSSIAIRDIIDNELFNFDPLDSFWKTISEEEFEENAPSIEANNVKEEKISLYELKASLQALKFRKQTLKNQLYCSAGNPGLCNEIKEVAAQCIDVEKRIRELQIKVVSYQGEKRYD